MPPEKSELLYIESHKVKNVDQLMWNLGKTVTLFAQAMEQQKDFIVITEIRETVPAK